MELFKYHRTLHLPWSPGAKNDDRIATEGDLGQLGACDEWVVSVKMDGENTTIYPGGRSHARSMDSLSHPSRTWVRAFAGRVGPFIPSQHHLCGENCYAEHSLRYEDLESYFLLFSMWRGDWCLPWDEMMAMVAMMNEDMGEEALVTVPVIYRGRPCDLEALTESFLLEHPREEGFVVRTSGGYGLVDTVAGSSTPLMAKWVRKDHVTTDAHWMEKEVVPNLLRSK